MSEPIAVRMALPGDWPEVAALLAELGRPEALDTPDEAALRSVYDDYLARADAAVLVALEGERIVGVCDLEFRVRLNFAGSQAWIPDLIVAADARSRGAGAALLAEAERIARDRGCWSMTLESATWRTRAHAFYRRNGWADTGRSFVKSLDGRPWPPPPPDSA